MRKGSKIRVNQEELVDKCRRWSRGFTAQRNSGPTPSLLCEGRSVTEAETFSSATLRLGQHGHFLPSLFCKMMDDTVLQADVAVLTEI